MNRFSQLITVTLFLLCFAITSFSQDRTWQTYTPKNNQWTILSPGVMNADQEALKENSKQGSFTYNDFNGFFAVIYKDYGSLNFLPWKKGHFTKQRNLVVKSNKGKLISDVEFTDGNISGREVQVRMPDNRVIGRESNIKPSYRVQRFRMFFQGNRFYTVLAVVPETEVNSEEITKYLNSFDLK